MTERPLSAGMPARKRRRRSKRNEPWRQSKDYAPLYESSPEFRTFADERKAHAWNEGAIVASWHEHRRDGLSPTEIMRAAASSDPHAIGAP